MIRLTKCIKDRQVASPLIQLSKIRTISDFTKGKRFSGTRIRTYILVHDLAGYLREYSISKEKSLYQRPNEPVPFYIRKVTTVMQGHFVALPFNYDIY